MLYLEKKNLNDLLIRYKELYSTSNVYFTLQDYGDSEKFKTLIPIQKDEYKEILYTERKLYSNFDTGDKNILMALILNDFIAMFNFTNICIISISYVSWVGKTNSNSNLFTIKYAAYYD